MNSNKTSLAMTKRLRTLDTYFSSPATKKSRVLDSTSATPQQNEGVANDIAIQEQDISSRPGSAERSDSEDSSFHPTYPFTISRLPSELADILLFSPACEARHINDQPDLDLMYYQPYIPKEVERDLFNFLRSSLPFYRVKYSIKRGEFETLVNTPRFTTVFGLDETSQFAYDGAIVDTKTRKCVSRDVYGCAPRPIPQCLAFLKELTESSTGHTFNFALVNYYADGNDSISYHSDDERFLGPNPAIASFTLGAKRDFLMRHKPTAASHASEKTPLKLQLASGDMVLMKGKTQNHWLHSIPKRKGKSDEARMGRINITFRRAMVKGGTENYYRYNVGEVKEVYRWDWRRKEMVSS